MPGFTQLIGAVGIISGAVYLGKEFISKDFIGTAFFTFWVGAEVACRIIRFSDRPATD